MNAPFTIRRAVGTARGPLPIAGVLAAALAGCTPPAATAPAGRSAVGTVPQAATARTAETPAPAGGPGDGAAGDGSAAASPAAARARNVVRKKLPRNLSSIALEYTVILIDDNGGERPVDPSTHTFRVGDSFLVRIKPQDDVYVYVFNEGPTGDRICLVPASDEAPRLVRSGEELSLPEGDFLQFAEPAGEEKLLVVALPHPTDDVRVLARNAFAAERGRIASSAAAEGAEAAAARRALAERSGPTTRGPVRKVLERLDAPLGADERLTHVEPPGEGETSSYGIVISGGDAGPTELVLDIPLRSTGPTPAR